MTTIENKSIIIDIMKNQTIGHIEYTDFNFADFKTISVD